MNRTKYQICCTWNERLETGVLTTSTRILLYNVFCSRAHARFPLQIRRRRLQDFVYL